jgi:xylulokinase
MPFYLGVDLGTSFIKASLLDGEGRVVARARLESSVFSPREGFFEVDAEEVWWKSFLSICRKMCSEVPAASIRALCVSSVCGSFVPVDEAFRPVHNAILYGIDRRSEALAAALNAHYGEEFLQRRLGNVFSTHSVLPKILWLKENRPEEYRQAAFFVSSFNFISARLTGVPSWDVPTAYGALMLDEETEEVPKWFLEDQGIAAEKIPAVGPAVAPLGTVTNRAASETGLAAGTVVMRGACDVNAEAMAVRAVAPETAVAVFGSTVSLLLNTEAPRNLKGFMTGRSLFPGVWRIGAATASGGRTVEWGRKLGAIAAPASPTGIFFIPYLDGARTPFNDPSARGAFLGLTSAHTPTDMAAAVLESLGYELAMIISKMEEAAPFPTLVEASGGLVNMPGLMELVADVTGKSLRPHPGVDASYGDALIAMTAVSPDALPSPGDPLRVVHPSERAVTYARLRTQWEEKIA